MARDEVSARSRRKCSKTLYGVKVFPGIVIGRARLTGLSADRVEHIYLPEGMVEEEITRFRKAVDLAEEQLLRTRDKFCHDAGECSAIIDSHLHILRDVSFLDRALDIIRGQEVNAEWALEISLARVGEKFAALEDAFLRERFHDLEQVAACIIRALGGSEAEAEEGSDEEVVIVARDLAPEDILHLAARKNVGLATALGSITSHSAIVARNTGIVSIMGVGGLTDKVVSDDLLLLDGYAGKLVVNPTEEQLQQAREQLERSRRYSETLASFSHLAAETADGLTVAVTANLELSEECALALSYGATGIGLFRSEYTYMVGRGLPTEEQLFASYRQLLDVMRPMPVTVRTIDAGGDKLLRGLSMPKEKNPALGLRAVRLSLLHEEVLRVQLRALYRASRYGQLRLLWPMVSNLQELESIKRLCREVTEQLRREGETFDAMVPQGVMIEVPSAVALADVMAAEVDFFSIGTNDLIQYTLAVDRGNVEVAHLYDPFNPSVLRMIRQVVESGHAAGIEVVICGEMAADLACVPLLLGIGADELSMTPLAIPYVKRLIRAARVEELEELAERLLRLPSSRQVQTALRDFLSLHFGDEIEAGTLERLRQGAEGVSAEVEGSLRG